MFLFLAGISAAYAIHHNYQCMLKVNNSFYHSYCTCVGAFRHAPALLQVAFWDVFIYVSMLDSKVRLVRDIETLETRSLVLLYTELRGFAVRVALVLALLVMPVYVLVGRICWIYDWIRACCGISVCMELCVVCCLQFGVCSQRSTQYIPHVQY